MTTKGRPWLKFYPADWQSDPLLGACSLASRGFWIECMCLMHEAEPYGHLLINGTKPDSKVLATLCKTSLKTARKCLQELSDRGVFGTTEEGVIFSRRMVKDKEKSASAAERGRKGGNPKLLKEVNLNDNLEDKPSRARVPEARGQILEKQLTPPTGPPLENGGTDKRKRGKRLPDDWEPSDADREFCQRERPGLDVDRLAAEFRDYWHAVPGAKGCKLDWSATWRNRVRQVGGNGPKMTTAEILMAHREGRL